jgi:uracil-DNA glycosylase
VTRRALDALVGPGWAEALAPVADRIAELGDRLRAEQAAGRGFLPSGDRIFAAFRSPSTRSASCRRAGPLPDARAPDRPVLLGRARRAPAAGSLRNIFDEYEDDLGLPRPATGDLTPWVQQGVLLLNRVLTVRPGAPASHRGWGWEEVTDAAIDALVARGRPLVAVLWGRDARSLAPRLGAVPRIESAHPSPLSAHRGFLGSRPFSRVDALLEEQGADPVGLASAVTLTAGPAAPWSWSESVATSVPSAAAGAPGHRPPGSP